MGGWIVQSQFKQYGPWVRAWIQLGPDKAFLAISVARDAPAFACEMLEPIVEATRQNADLICFALANFLDILNRSVEAEITRNPPSEEIDISEWKLEVVK